MTASWMADRPLRGKYAPLHRYLQGREESPWHVSFRQIEALLGQPLPISASTYPAWWANDRTHRQAFAWIAAGWMAEGLDLPNETIVFRRVRPVDS